MEGEPRSLQKKWLLAADRFDCKSIKIFLRSASLKLAMRIEFFMVKIKCPVCNKSIDGCDIINNSACQPLVCECGFEIRCDKGFLDFLSDDLDTKLDQVEYIKQHPLSSGESIFNYFYAPFFSKYLSVSREIAGLELASGPGQLTCFMAAEKNIDFLVSSDISPKFLIHQLSNIKSANVIFARFDANQIPFDKSSFDVIYGNSVLHHFLNYDKTIEQCFELLKPGGIAVFGEPLVTGHMPTMTFQLVLAEFLKSTGCNKNLDVINALQQSAKNTLKLHKMSKCADPQLSDFEDKYLFSVSGMRSLARKFGFSDFVVLNDLCPDHAAHAPNSDLILSRATELASFYTEKYPDLSDFKWLADILQESLVEPCAGDESVAAFTSFAFVK